VSAAPRRIDLVDPSPHELVSLVPARLDPEAVEALCASSGDGRDARPALESHGTYLFGALLIPGALDPASRVVYHELDVVATPDALVTVRKSGPDGSVADLSVLDHAEDSLQTGLLVHRLVDAAAETYLDLVDALYAEIDELEDHLDDVPSPMIRHRLSDLRHEMLHARRNASATRAAVRRVVDGRLDLGANDALFPRDAERAFAETYDTLVRAIEELDVARDLLASVRDYLQSKVAENQSEIVKKLTMVASLVLVPTLITGFYGQNFVGAFDEGYWSLGVSVGLIVASTLVQLAFFRWRRWL
jgi:Mg2+ and Co2+ transporter CorA